MLWCRILRPRRKIRVAKPKLEDISIECWGEDMWREGEWLIAKVGGGIGRHGLKSLEVLEEEDRDTDVMMGTEDVGQRCYVIQIYATVRMAEEEHRIF